MKKRRRGIGGSDVHHIFNLPPYGCAAFLWDEKRGVKPDYPSPYNPHLERGTALEAIAARLYKKREGFKLAKAPTVTSKIHPYIRGTADRIILAKKDGDDWIDDNGLLEIKCPSRDAFLRHKADGIPQSYILQLQHYLYLYGLRWGVYAIFCADLWELITFRVERDNNLIETIIDAEGRFWRSVEFGPRPAGLEIGDKRCRECVRRKSCWASDIELVERLTAVDDDDIPDVSEEKGYVDAITGYQAAEIDKEEAEEKMRTYRICLEKIVGVRPVVKGRGRIIRWTPTVTKRWNTKMLEVDHPELTEKYKEKKLSRRFYVK